MERTTVAIAIVMLSILTGTAADYQQPVVTDINFAGLSYTLYHTASQRQSLVMVFGGGWAGNNVETTSTTMHDQLDSFAKILVQTYDVVLVNDLYYPSNKSALDSFFLHNQELYRCIHMFGISAGAIIVMAYAQQESAFASSIICSAPADYYPLFDRPEPMYHLGNTANQTKIPLLFILPSLDEDFCSQMTTYYSRDTTEKQLVYWNVQHNPFEWQPTEFATLCMRWFEGENNVN
jgi:hypothetical protein